MRGLVLLALLVGCGGEDDRPANWAYISQAIVQPNCATSNCHSPLATTEGLDLSTEASGYTYLVTGHDFVVPGQPDESPLLFYLRGKEFPRMPPDAPLPQADIDLISRWIAAGAPEK